MEVSNLLRIEIEAKYAVPLIKVFMAELGKEETFEIIKKLHKPIMIENGRQIAKFVGGNTMDYCAKVNDMMFAPGEIEWEDLELTPTRYSVNITKCAFAELYKKLGYEEFGYIMVCSSDFPICEGFNPKMKLTRTQTIMEGADYCDFRYTMVDVDDE